MNLVIIKIADVLSRALFTVGATYGLTIYEAGKFGLASTLVGLFAFAFGWERHIDIQRRLAGRDARAFDHAVRALPRFWAANWCMMAPFLFVLTFWLADLNWKLCIVVAVIAICEQIGNAAYNLCVVESRFRGLVVIAAGKSLVLMFAVAAIFLFARDWLTLSLLLWMWGTAGLLSVSAIAIGWARAESPKSHMDLEARGQIQIHTDILDQHKASFTHFITGALAVLIIQIDRLIVGVMLPLGEVGTYFRHVVLVSFAYQLFNVVSYNRKLPHIFELARENYIKRAQAVIGREYLMIFTLVGLAFVVGVFFDLAVEHVITRSLLIDVTLVALLLIGSLLRVHADFSALILNAQFREKSVLANQMIGFVIGCAALVSMTHVFGLYGTALGTMAGAGVYFIMNFVSVRNLTKRIEA